MNDKGITKACPECRKILIASAEMIGYGQFEQNIKCAYCGTRLKIVVGQKTFIAISKIIGIVFIVSFIASSFYQLAVLTQLNANLSYLIQNYDFNIQK